MTTHKHVGPQFAELVMPVEPQPHCEQTTYDDGRPGILTLWGWKNRDDCLYVSKHKHDIEQCIREHCPFRHGDVVEFWPACDFRGCDNAGRYRFISPHLYRESDSVHCGNHALEGRDPVNPTFRTVTRVEVRQGDGWEWVVFLSEESNNAETT